jgi:hypothetical protein
MQKLSITQEKLKERVEKAREIYEKVLSEYQQIPHEKRWSYDLNGRASAEIQIQLVVSERKAREYLKVAKVLHKRMVIPQIT